MWLEENDPQPPATEQVAVQSTPSLTAAAILLVIVAVTGAPPLTVSVGGGAGALNVTLLAMTVTFPEANFVGSATEVAVMVTDICPAAAVVNVKVVATPLCVFVGANVPDVLGVHVQLIPLVDESFARAAAI